MNNLISLARSVWPFDREPIDMGVETGIVWATVKGPVGVNGYALIPAEGHAWSAGLPDDYDDFLDVHGGITYAQHPWIGFDTCHAGDYWADEYDEQGITRYFIDKYTTPWTPVLVAAAAASLAKQVAEVGT